MRVQKETAIKKHIETMKDQLDIWQNDPWSRQARINYRCSMNAKDRVYSYWFRINRVPLRQMLYNQKLPYWRYDRYRNNPKPKGNHNKVTNI